MSDAAYNDGLKAYFADDFTEALRHWGLLAEGGHAGAAFRLGHMHETGQGVPRDATKAAYWFERAGKAGSHQAMAALGDLLLNGIGVPQDYARAYMWLSLAATGGDFKVRNLRDEVARHLSSEQIAELEDEARRMFGHMA